MLRRTKLDNEKMKDINEVIDKRVRRIWIMFGLGLIAESLHIGPSKLSISGVEFSIQQGESLIGTLYLIVLVYFFFTFVNLMFYGATSTWTLKPQLRNLIWLMAGSPRTLIGKSHQQIKLIKRSARSMVGLYQTLQFFVLMTPAATIAFFKFGKVFAALSTIVFGSKPIT